LSDHDGSRSEATEPHPWKGAELHTNSLTYRIAEGVLSRRVGDELILLHPEKELLFSVRGSGPRIWELLNEGESIEQLPARLVLEFDAPEPVVRLEIDAFLAQLERENLLARNS
jgi:hypothetical protein